MDHASNVSKKSGVQTEYQSGEVINEDGDLRFKVSNETADLLDRYTEKKQAGSKDMTTNGGLRLTTANQSLLKIRRLNYTATTPTAFTEQDWRLFRVRFLFKNIKNM